MSLRLVCFLEKSVYACNTVFFCLEGSEGYLGVKRKSGSELLKSIRSDEKKKLYENGKKKKEKEKEESESSSKERGEGVVELPRRNNASTTK